MGIFIKNGILHTLKFHLHTLSCHFWLNLCPHWTTLETTRLRNHTMDPFGNPSNQEPHTGPPWKPLDSETPHWTTLKAKLTHHWRIPSNSIDLKQKEKTGQVFLLSSSSNIQIMSNTAPSTVDPLRCNVSHS